MFNCRQFFTLLLIFVPCAPEVLPQGRGHILEQAVRLIERNNILQAAAELDLEPQQIFLATDISGDGRYIRYELAGEEGYHEARLISVRPDFGMLVCSVKSACDPICKQSLLQCHQVAVNNTVTDVSADVLPGDLYDSFEAKLKALHEKAENNAPDENEPCPFWGRIIMPRESRESSIKLGYVCGLQADETVEEMITLEYRNGKFFQRWAK